MFDLTTIQLRNVREKVQSGVSKLFNRSMHIGMKSVVNALKAEEKDLNETPIDVLDIWSKQ